MHCSINKDFTANGQAMKGSWCCLNLLAESAQIIYCTFDYSDVEIRITIAACAILATIYLSLMATACSIRITKCAKFLKICQNFTQHNALIFCCKTSIF